MPFDYVVYKDRRLVISTGSGRLTCAEIKARQDQTETDPDFDPEFNQLGDLRAVTNLDGSIEEFKTLARRQVFSPKSRRALVASSPAIFGMARLWEAHSELAQEATQIHVFSDLASAVEWLGIGDISDILR